METRHPDTFGSFASQPGHAAGCHWVPLSVPGSVEALTPLLQGVQSGAVMV